jgi:hypothetical protein
MHGKISEFFFITGSSKATEPSKITLAKDQCAIVGWLCYVTFCNRFYLVWLAVNHQDKKSDSELNKAHSWLSKMKPSIFGVPLTFIFDWTFTAMFGYLLFDSIAVIWLNGYTSRISLFGFLIPHASKLALWSLVSLLWLRPRFGWRFPFATVLLYSLAELITNAIYVPVHLLSDPYYQKVFFTFGNPDIFFGLSNVFFVFSIVLANTVLRKNFSFRKDWSMLPFGMLIGVWVSAGYITDSSMFYAAPGIELAEFSWSLLYLFMMVRIFHPKQAVLSR